MINATHQSVLHHIAEHINDTARNSSEGKDQNSHRAEVHQTDSHWDQELWVYGQFPGIPTRFAVPFVLWFIVEGDSLLMCARIIPELVESWHKTWVIDGQTSGNTLKDEDVTLLEQSMAAFSQFCSAFSPAHPGQEVPVTINAFSDLYVRVLNERFVEKTFVLSEEQMFVQLHAHLVTLGMQHLPPFPLFPQPSENS